MLAVEFARFHWAGCAVASAVVTFAQMVRRSTPAPNPVPASDQLS
jgi:hypothetical protein